MRTYKHILFLIVLLCFTACNTYNVDISDEVARAQEFDELLAELRAIREGQELLKADILAQLAANAERDETRHQETLAEMAALEAAVIANDNANKEEVLQVILESRRLLLAGQTALFNAIAANADAIAENRGFIQLNGETLEAQRQTLVELGYTAEEIAAEMRANHQQTKDALAAMQETIIASNHASRDVVLEAIVEARDYIVTASATELSNQLAPVLGNQAAIEALVRDNGEMLFNGFSNLNNRLDEQLAALKALGRSDEEIKQYLLDQNESLRKIATELHEVEEHVDDLKYYWSPKILEILQAIFAIVG